MNLAVEPLQKATCGWFPEIIRGVRTGSQDEHEGVELYPESNSFKMIPFNLKHIYTKLLS